MKVITNNKPRELLCGHDLTDKEREEFDYLSWNDDSLESWNEWRFFRYKGNVYDTQDCEPIFRDTIQDFKAWDGIFTETFFSGVVFKYAPDSDWEEVIVGRYFT